MEFCCRCNVCGKIYCYTDQDLKDNAKNAGLSALSALGTMASVFGGTKIDAYAQNNMSDRYGSKVVDYSRCPSCNSSDISMLSDEEWSKYQSNGGNGFQAKKIDINSNASVESLLKRTKMFLEEEDWESADAYCEHILDVDPECAMVYVYKLMIDLKVTEQDKLADLNESFEDNKMYQKALKFADAPLKELLEDYIYAIVNRNLDNAYNGAVNAIKLAITEEDYLDIVPKFEELGEYKDSKQLIVKCKEEAETARKNSIYNNAVNLLDSMNISAIEKAVTEFGKISGWRDSDKKKVEALEKIEQINENKKKEDNEKQLKLRKIIKLGAIYGVVVAFIVVMLVLLTKFYINPTKKYNNALKLCNEGKYEEAIKEFTELGEFKDSADQVIETQYQYSELLFNNGDYQTSADIFSSIMNYKDSKNKIEECEAAIIEEKYISAIELCETEDYRKAIEIFDELEDYKDTEELLNKAMYEYGCLLFEDKKYEDAIVQFEKCTENNAIDKLNDSKAGYILAHKTTKNDVTMKYLKELNEVGYSNYDELNNAVYTLTPRVIANTSEQDLDMDEEKFSTNDTIFFHVLFEGGKEDDYIFASMELTTPFDKSSDDNKIYSEGDTCTWIMRPHTPAGTYVLRVRDGNQSVIVDKVISIKP